MKSSSVVPQTPSSDEVPAAPSSWTSLLAATTLGVVGASVVHADVQGDASLVDGKSYRLIVQSYEDESGPRAGDRRRPLASTQRAVTKEELHRGVRVGLLEFKQDRRVADPSPVGSRTTPVVLAWVEEGKPDLPLDGLRARPKADSLRGTALRKGAVSAVQISIQRPSRAA